MTLADPPAPEIAVARLSPEEVEAALPDLAELLHATVLAGASINFLHPFETTEAAAFWREKVLPGARRGLRRVLVARGGGRLLGSVQLDADTPPNQPHRAEVTKLMVHPEARRRGIGRALMRALEAEARGMERWLLTLDTRSGDAAEPLYESLGFVPVGRIPDYSRHPSEARFEATTIMVKRLA